MAETMQDAPNKSYPLNGLATPANAITMSRIFMTPVLCMMVLANEPTRGASWGAAVIGLLMGATDYVDGKVARATNSFSRSGAFLDPLADKIIVLGAGFSFVAVGAISWIPMTLIAIREVVISAIRSRYAAKGLAIPARWLAKWKATFQGIALLIAATPPLSEIPYLVATVLWLACALTLYTGWQYILAGESAARGKD